jgi:hypothetical protein
MQRQTEHHFAYLAAVAFGLSVASSLAWFPGLLSLSNSEPIPLGKSRRSVSGDRRLAAKKANKKRHRAANSRKK